LHHLIKKLTIIWPGYVRRRLGTRHHYQSRLNWATSEAAEDLATVVARYSAMITVVVPSRATEAVAECSAIVVIASPSSQTASETGHLVCITSSSAIVSLAILSKSVIEELGRGLGEGVYNNLQNEKKTIQKEKKQPRQDNEEKEKTYLVVFFLRTTAPSQPSGLGRGIAMDKMLGATGAARGCVRPTETMGPMETMGL
jgi:hypothetical protein